MSAGRLRVQVPSGPPFSKSYRKADSQGFGIAFLRSSVSINRSEFSVRSVAANTLGLGPRDRRCNSCRADHFQIAAVVEHIRHPPSKRNDAGGNPAGSTRFKLPGGVKVARRFVKPHGAGASPALAASSGRQADTSWLHLSRKQDRQTPRSEHYRRLPPILVNPTKP